MRAGAEIQEEWLIGRYLLRVANELYALVDQVFGQVIALLRCLRRLDLVVVIDQIGIILVGVAAQESVIPLETAAQRPTIVRTRRTGLFRGCQVPFAYRIRVVPVHQQGFGEESVLEWYDPIRSRITRCALRDAGHPVRMMIAPGKNARPRR